MDKENLEEFRLKALMEIFTTPMQLRDSFTDDVNPDLKFKAITEKMIKLMKAETREEIKKAVTEQTDAETLCRLLNTSHIAPLNSEGMKKLEEIFKKLFPQKYKEIFKEGF